MPGPDFDPRGRANRALLAGVYRYEHAENLPGVRHNLGEMFDALISGGLFGTSEIRTVSPEYGSEFRTALDRAAAEARGLLLVYFAGHGRLSHDGSELFLAFGRSRRLPGDEPHYSEAVSWNEVLRTLRAVAESGTVGHIVVILDCCYAGNALESFKPGALQPGRERISVLTAVQVNRRIPAGDGHAPTPYTRHLVRLLRGGTAQPPAMGGGTATAAGGGADGPDRLVRLTALAAGLHEALRGRRTVDGDPWEPRHYLAEGDRDVILGTAGGPHRDTAARSGGPARLRAALAAARERRAAARRAHGQGRPARPRPGRTLRERLRHPGRAGVLIGAACAVLLAGGGYGVARLTAGAAPCPPPVQLRLLTDPDVQPTMSRAVDAFLGSPADRRHGCRLAGIGLEAPKADDAVAGFRQSAQWRDPLSAGSFQPQRDIGAQPDIWIPGSSVSYQRARAGAGAQAASLESLGPVAYSPVVLAVLRTFAVAPVNTTGVPLADLVTTLEQKNRGTVVLRADPEYTDTAQLATVGLYGTNAGQTAAADGAVRGLEQQAAQLSPAPRSSYELMCALAGRTQLEDRAAVLVPEQVMAQFDNAGGTHDETGCDTGTLGQRVPQYPADVGVLDLPFVRVRWQGGDRDAAARDRAVDAFHTWLTGADGQRVFTDSGYRGRGDRPDRPAPPPAGSWLTGPGRAVADPETIGYDVSGAAVDQALARYRTARGSGQMLYLLDSSTSMGDAGNRVWSGQGRAKDLVAQSLEVFAPDDAYGVWTVSGTRPPVHALAPLDAHPDPAAVRKALAAAGTGGEADPPAALRAALETLRSHPVGGGPQSIVFVTDDEDDTWFSDADVKQLVQAAAAQKVAIDWVSLLSGGCTGGSGHRGPQLAAGTGGRCLDPSDNQAAGLRDAAALIGTGDAR